MKPACMTEGEYVEWQAANRLVHSRSRSTTPCVDCPATWHVEQLARGTCDGTPGPLPGRRTRRPVTEQRERWKLTKRRQRAQVAL